MNLSNSELKKLVDKYNSPLQIKAYLADTQNLIGELGRGSGKTTEILAPRILRVAWAMPRSTMALAGPSYIFVIDTIVKGLLTYLNTHYKRGVHFEYGKRPPNFFNQPLIEETDWRNTLSFPCGTVIVFVGVDRPNTSGIGQNFAHVFIDELLRISEGNFIERLSPARRGNRQLFGNSPYFGGITGFSSTPNYENDHDWWLKYEDDYREHRAEIDEIMAVALRISNTLHEVEMMKRKDAALTAREIFEEAKRSDRKIEEKLRFVSKWEGRLAEHRKNKTYYMKGTSFSNLVILGLDYIREQYKGAKANPERFLLSILSIRPEKVKNKFFHKFEKRHIFTDTYTYNHIDLHSIDGSYVKSSRDLKYVDPKRPLLAGYDPGAFQSIVFAQEFEEEGETVCRFLKNFYAFVPDEHYELAQQINEYFKYGQRKVIYLWYDRAGNKTLKRYARNPKGATDIAILKAELVALGWTVHLKSENQRTIYYWEHHNLWSRLLGEREKRTPRLRFCQFECEETISSIQSTPMSKTDDGSIEMDKSAEKKLDFAEQAWHSPQLASAVTYLIFGLYEKWTPQRKAENRSIEGL
jgi:hypothetical protein